MKRNFVLAVLGCLIISIFGLIVYKIHGVVIVLSEKVDNISSDLSNFKALLDSLQSKKTTDSDENSGDKETRLSIVSRNALYIPGYVIDDNNILYRNIDDSGQIVSEDVIIKNYRAVMGLAKGSNVETIAKPENNQLYVAESCADRPILRRIWQVDIATKTVKSLKSVVYCAWMSSKNQERLVYVDSRADRIVLVDLLEDKSQEIGILPKPYTYAKYDPGSDWIPETSISIADGIVEALVYDGRVPAKYIGFNRASVEKYFTLPATFDHDERLPVMKKDIGIDYLF